MQNSSPTETLSRKDQKRATRQSIRAAALRCFAERGYGETQIGQITESAGIAKGTFYVHFRDKDELLDELLHEFNDGFVARIGLVWTPDAFAQPRHLIESVAAIFLAYWEENRAFLRAYAEKSALGVPLEELQFGVNPQMQELLRVALERAAATRGVAIEHSELVLQGVLAMWLRLGLQALFNPAVHRDAVLETLSRLTIGALSEFLPNA